MTTRSFETANGLFPECVRGWAAAGLDEKAASEKLMDVRHENACFGRLLYPVEVGQGEKKKWMVGVESADGKIVLQEM